MPKEERRVSVLVLQIRFAELSPETAERYMFANRNMRDFYAPAPFLFKPQRSHCRAFFCFSPSRSPIALGYRSLGAGSLLPKTTFWAVKGFGRSSRTFFQKGS
jgi:hypothetical protein